MECKLQKVCFGGFPSQMLIHSWSHIEICFTSRKVPLEEKQLNLKTDSLEGADMFYSRSLHFPRGSQIFLIKCSGFSEIPICSIYLYIQFTNLRAHVFKVKCTTWPKAQTFCYLNPKWISEIISLIKDPTASVPLRPSLSEDKGNEKIVAMARACWDESPEKRPTFSSIKKILRESSSKGWVRCVTFSPNHLTIRILFFL